MKNNVPKICFKGFSGEWTLQRLSELMDFSNGINASKERYGKGRKMISVMDILDKSYLRYENIRSSVEVSQSIEIKNKVESGDIVFVRSSEVPEEVGWAKAYLEKEYALYSGFTIRGKKKRDFDSSFVELSLNYSNRNQIERKAGGSTRFNVSQGILNSLELLMASAEAQKKIGTFFHQFDNTIALQQQLIDQQQQVKKAMLQKMFPQNGERVPKIRFAGFSGEWEENNLDKFCYVQGGFAFKSSIFQKSGIPIIRISEIQNGVVEDGTVYYPESVIIDTNFTIKYGDILIAMSGATTGKVGVYKSPKVSYLNQRVGKFVGNEKLDYQFLKVVLDSDLFSNALKLLLVAGAQPNISSSDITSISLPFPNSLEEQQKIGTLFTQLDENIELNQQKLNKLKQLKLAFLQKMFI